MYEAFDRLPEAKRVAIVQSGVREFSRRTYSEASTDEMTKSGGISKGLLFHYFGTKRAFYLYCLEQSLKKLVATSPMGGDDFYGIIFSMMDEKMRLCNEYPDEMRFVNMAARDADGEIAQGKGELFSRYLADTNELSGKVMARAVDSLALKEAAREKALEALRLYTRAIINKYLIEYRETPDAFFESADKIKKEMKEYIDLMLYGVVEGRS